MTISYGSALVFTALLASLVLVTERGNRVFPIVALLAAALEALIAFGVITFSVRSLRIDVILPALLVASGLACWMRTANKPQVTAATLVTIVGLLQLLTAVRVFK